MRLSTEPPSNRCGYFPDRTRRKEATEGSILGSAKMSIGTFLSTINTPGLDLDIETSAGEGTL